MDKEGFKENSSLADEEKFGRSAYFVSEEWYDENYEEKEYNFNVKTVIENPVEISIAINAFDYEEPLINTMEYYLLVKLDMNWADEFDVNAFWVTTQNRYDQFLRTIIEYDFSDNDELYFGTNEYINFESKEELFNSLVVTEITSSVHSFIIALIGKTFVVINLETLPEQYSDEAD